MPSGIWNILVFTSIARERRKEAHISGAVTFKLDVDNLTNFILMCLFVY